MLFSNPRWESPLQPLPIDRSSRICLRCSSCGAPLAARPACTYCGSLSETSHAPDPDEPSEDQTTWPEVLSTLAIYLIAAMLLTVESWWLAS